MLRVLKLAFLPLVLLATAAAADTDDNPRTVSVNGESEVKVVPDEVVLTLGIETSDKDLGVAKAANDRAMEAVIASVLAAGVPRKDAQTDFLRIEPRYGDSYRQQDFIGFFVQKTLVVTLKDLSKFEPLLSAALESGANYVHGIDFRTTELRKHRDEARLLAIRAAREKAGALAGELGRKIGEPRSIQEGWIGWWSSYGGWGDRGLGMLRSQNVAQNAAGSGGSDDPFAPGTISVKASVSVTFDLD